MATTLPTVAGRIMLLREMNLRLRAMIEFTLFRPRGSTAEELDEYRRLRAAWIEAADELASFEESEAALQSD